MSHSQTTVTLQPAGLLRRLAAMVYDSLLLLGLLFVYAGIFAVSIPNWLASEPVPLGEVAYGPVGKALFQLSLAVIIVGFFTYFWRRGGQTLGMRAWRLKVQTREGDTLSIQQCLLRCLLAPFSMALGGLGYLWCLVDPTGQTLHDRLSATRVVTLPKDQRQRSSD